LRDVVFWLSGAALAFVVTAGAFLLLANLATVPPEKSLTPNAAAGRSTPAMELALDAARLEALRPRPGQNLDLALKNEGSRPLSNVNVTLSVSSENTALSGTRYYRRTVGKVAADRAADVHFGFDLSPPKGSIAGPRTPEPAREILEIKATTPEGISTVRTVILPP
jgi:hypothetical protein